MGSWLCWWLNLDVPNNTIHRTLCLVNHCFGEKRHQIYFSSNTLVVKKQQEILFWLRQAEIQKRTGFRNCKKHPDILKKIGELHLARLARVEKGDYLLKKTGKNFLKLKPQDNVTLIYM